MGMGLCASVYPGGKAAKGAKGVSIPFGFGPHERGINGEHMWVCQVIDILHLDRNTLRQPQRSDLVSSGQSQ